ncbi:MAG: hypothetical protein ACFFAU_17950 [Candidatus Hodarchaeota archaeon]
MNNRDTIIPYIFINLENRTTEKTYEIAWNEAFNVSIAYNDTVTGAFIMGATVTIAGSGLPAKTLLFDDQNYTVVLNSYELGVGVHYLTILANQVNYSSASVNIIITVIDRSSLIDDIFINLEDRTTEKTYEIAWNEAFNVSIAYNDTVTGAFLMDAYVTIAGSGFPAQQLPYDTQNYSVVLNSYDLGVGVHYLTILATRINHSSASVNIIITVMDRSSLIDDIFINLEDRTTEKTYEIAWNEAFNVSIAYNDTVTGAFLMDAYVTIAGSGFPAQQLPYDTQNYSITLDSYDLGVGVHYLTILATKGNYTSASVNIIITVVDRSSLIDDIFINLEDRTTEKTYEIAWNEAFNVSIAYNDTATGTFLMDAYVTIAGSGIPTQQLPYDTQNYSVVLNSYDLGIGVHYLTILATKINYSSASVNIIITVVDRSSLIDDIFINLEDRTTEKTYEIEWNEAFNVSIAYNDTTTGAFLMDAYVTIAGSGFPARELPYDTQNYSITLDSYDLGVGVHYLTILATKGNYTSASVNIIITVVDRSSLIDDIFINLEDRTTEKTYEIAWNEAFNVSIAYNDTATGTFLMDAYVTIAGSGIPTQQLPYDTQNYSVVLNSYDLGIGVHYLTILATKGNYTSASELITITVANRETYLITDVNITSIVSEIYQTKIGETLNITVWYRDYETGNYLDNATVELRGLAETKSLTRYGQQYTILLPAENISLGVRTLTINAKQDNYTLSSEDITVYVAEKGSLYNLFLDGVNYTGNEDITLTVNVLLNISLAYKEELSPHNPITGALISINGSGISELLDFNVHNNYSVLINTTDLNQGINFLTIYAQADNYETLSILLIISIVEIQTNLTLYIDELDLTATPSIKRTIDEVINITVTFKELLSPYDFIAGASINATIPSKSWNIKKHPTFLQYNLTLDTNELNPGLNFITIYALRANYQPQTLTLTVEIIAKETFLNVSLNEQDITSISLKWNEVLNVSITYKIDPDGTHIGSATVTIEGTEISDELKENGQRYNLTINTVSLGVGRHYLTILAQKPNFEVQSVSIFVIVSEADAYSQLFIDGVEKFQDAVINAYTNVTVNITIIYKDSVLNSIVSGATMQIAGGGLTGDLNLTEYSPGYYYYMLNTSHLAETTDTHILSVLAQADNHSSQPISFTIRVIDKLTEIKYYINGVDKTSDTSLTIAYGKLLRFEVNYTDAETGKIIDGSIVTLYGEGLSINLTQDSRYWVVINTATIDIGVRYLFISASKPHYGSQKETFAITVRRIITEIELLDYDNDEIDIKPGEDVKIRVKLKDLDFGDVITGAIVEYTWEHGDGEMDEKEDGIYEVTLEEVPEGTFTFVITVYADDEFEFKRKEIDINSIRPPEDIRLLIILATVIPIISAVGSILAYRQLRIVKTPNFVKKIKALKSIIKKGSEMPVHYVYPYRDEAFFKKYRKDWDKVGVPLNKTLGIKFSEKNLAKVKAKKAKINAYKFKKQKRPKE